MKEKQDNKGTVSPHNISGDRIAKIILMVLIIAMVFQLYVG
ncbi:hypothetical protein [Sphingobacterium sp. 2149]|nr:hypothetical protein [Sphingobacterium sp. 2149]MDR6736141.1 hypothetical protein [Sphingobacterium sp. 2149]